MSILGYSASYFYPEYWASTPLYGEKIIPLIDYILSTDFVQADKLANAFYAMENKYKNTADLPIDFIKEIIDESGYGYVLDLLGEDDDSIRLLTYLLVLIHQLKGTGLGIEVVLNLMKRDSNSMVLVVVGNPTAHGNEYSDFSETDFIYYKGLTLDSEPFKLVFPIKTGSFVKQQCIASVDNHGLYLGINSQGNLVLSLGSKNSGSWDIADNLSSVASLSPNTNYYIMLEYDGYEYDLKVSTDKGKRYTDYIVVDKNVPTGLHEAYLYLGVDVSNSYQQPFEGYIDIAPFSIDIKNVTITEWFEQFPIIEDEENTFIVKADLDLGVVSTDFFKNFARFVSKYVYPSLKAFDAKLKLKNNLTFIPFSRQKLRVVGSGEIDDERIEYYRELYREQHS